MNATLLAYQLDDKERRALRTLCTQKNVRLRVVQPEDFGQPIGALCGIGRRIDGQQADAPLPEHMLVFAHFGERQFDVVMNAMRSAHIGVGALKAVLTPTNVRWNAYTLSGHLRREHAEMQAALARAREAEAAAQAAEAAATADGE